MYTLDEPVRVSFRAAATRCREKRKIWVQQLEKKADDLSNTNAHLQVWLVLLFLLFFVCFVERFKLTMMRFLTIVCSFEAAW